MDHLKIGADPQLKNMLLFKESEDTFSIEKCAFSISCCKINRWKKKVERILILTAKSGYLLSSKKKE